MINSPFDFSFLSNIGVLNSLNFNINLLINNFLNFSPEQHVLWSIISCIFAFLIALKAILHYVKHKDKRMLIISLGFLAGGISEICHLLHFNKLPLQLFFMFVENLLYSISILLTIFISADKNENIVKRFYYLLFLASILLTAVTLYLLTTTDIISLKNNISYSAIIVTFNSLYILFAFIYADIRVKRKLNPLSKFTIGLFLLGFSKLYILNPDHFFLGYRHVNHFLFLIGLILIFNGLENILYKEKILSIKQKLLIYSSIALMSSYLIVILFCDLFLRFEFPNYINYLFLIFLVSNTFIQNFLSTKLTLPITKIIQALEEFKPYIKPKKITVISNDETGMLTETINDSTELIYQYYQELLNKQNQIENYIKKEKLLRKITETIMYNPQITSALEDITKDIADYFKVERASIVHIPSGDTQKASYLAKFRINSSLPFTDELNYDSKIEEYWYHSLHKDGSYIAIDNVLEAEIPEFFKEKYLSLGSKSILAIGIRKDDFYWGGIGLHKIYDYRKWTKNDIEFLKAIADQLYVAIKHSELHLISAKKAERENTLRRIISKVGSSLNVNEIKATFISEISKTLNSDVNVFYQVNTETNRFEPVDEYSVYKSSPDIKNFVGISPSDYNFEIFFIEKKKEAISSNYEEFIRENNLQGAPVEKFFKQFDIKSFIVIPVSYADTILGVLSINYVKDYQQINEDDIEFIRTLANQAGIALYQAELYNKEKKTADREALLRKIVETIRSTLDINEVLNTICDELGKLLDIKRVAITEFPKNCNYEEWILRKEYKFNNSIKGLNDVDFDPRTIAYAANYVLNLKILDIENISTSNTPDYFRKSYEELGVKSLLLAAIKKGDDIWGALFLSEYDKHRHWTSEEKELIQTITDQIYIAIKHAELYSITKKQAKRERILRDIITNIRGSLNINEIKKNIVQEAGIFLKASRCFIFEFDYEKEKPVSVDSYSEYLSDSSEKSIVGVDLEQPYLKYWVNMTCREKREVLILDIDEHFERHNLKDTETERLLAQFNIKTAIGIPILYAGKPFGALVIHFSSKQKPFSESEKDFFWTLANQAGVAFHQSKLFQDIKRQTEREQLLFKITTSIRETLNINEVKQDIVNSVGTAFQADRCYIRLFDADNDSLIDTEYLSSCDIKSAVNHNFDDNSNMYVKTHLSNNEPLIIPDTEDISANLNVYKGFNQFLLNFNTKSNYGFPIFNNGKFMGAFVIQYTKEKADLIQEDIDLLQMISNQAGVALYQSKLFNNIKQTAENEKAIAKILSTIKSNLNIDEVLMIICSELTNLFKVNQILIDEFNPLTRSIKTYKLFNLDVEDNYEQNYDLLTREFLFKTLIDEGSNLIIENIKNSNFPNKEFFIDRKLISVLAIPLKIANNRWGAISLYDSKVRQWTANEINLIKKLADYISLAIRDNYLYTQEEFVANVSHELKTPIAIINGYTEALISRDKEISAMSSKFLPIIKNNTNRLNSIVENLLYLSKLNKNIKADSNDFKRTELKNVIEDAIQNSERKAQDKSITINFNYDGPLFANINEFLINQALTNIINNAINYSSNNTIITINAYKENDKAKIEFHDQGCGIQEEHIPYIFERFYRAEKSRNRETGGTGLGLSIVKSFLDIHGGLISVKSVYKEGSTFTVELNIQE